ncbi:MAG: type II toxin-antitoxin system RelE/ParE family toxin [Phycisphaeraceae bacterium]|nr:type II toxin-antitoxin system RelE/ParE family toxin [Phycisphaeraceae bacterium]
MPFLTSFKKLRISDPAKSDLAGIGDYTQRQWGTVQKRKYLDQIKDTFKSLTQTPGLGSPCDDISKDLRAHPVGKHVIFYRDTKTILEIVRVLHGSMDVEPLRKN